MYFEFLHGIIEKNEYRKQQGAKVEENILVKRETGVNPVRSRHCKHGAKNQYTTGKPGRRFFVMICKSGDLPVAGTKTEFSGHEELAVPVYEKVFLSLFSVTFRLMAKVFFCHYI